MNTNLKSIYHKVDLCVVGGGLAGMCAAVAAARHGIKVVKTTEKQALLKKLHLKPFTETLTDVIRCGTLYCLNLSIMKKI